MKNTSVSCEPPVLLEIFMLHRDVESIDSHGPTQNNLNNSYIL